jgi:hypothetical protein
MRIQPLRYAEQQGTCAVLTMPVASMISPARSRRTPLPATSKSRRAVLPPHTQGAFKKIKNETGVYLADGQ